VPCQYCGKEIGALRLLKDSEFCSASHRESYKERLGRVLNQISDEPQATPQPAGFLVRMPLCPGNTCTALADWRSAINADSPRLPGDWPLAIDTLGGESAQSAEDLEAAAPPELARMSVHIPEPLEDSVERSLAARHVPAPVIALPLAERVTIPKQRFAPSACTGTMPVPPAEPVAGWIEPSLAAACTFARQGGTGIQPVGLVPGVPGPAQCPSTAPVPAAEPVAAFVQYSFARPLSAALPAAPPAFTLAAELEPMPEIETWLEPPAPCERWMPVPPAEPVWSSLGFAAAMALPAAVLQTAPRLAVPVRGAYMPIPVSLRPTPKPEPVMAGVWPHIADTQLCNIDEPLPVCLPEIRGLGGRRRSITAAGAARPALAEPVQSLMISSFVAVPEVAAVTRAPGIAAVAIDVPIPAIGRPAAGPEPEAAESLLAATAAGPALYASPARMQPFLVATSSHITIPGLEGSQIMASTEPASSAGPALDPSPIRTIHVQVPEPRSVRPAVVIPQAGPFSIEYHIQRERGAAVARPQWKACCFQPLAPRFAIRPAFDRLEELLKPKAEPAVLFRMPEPRRTRSVLMKHAPRVAAAVVAVTTLWFGVSAIKNTRRIATPEAASSFSTSDRVITADSQTGAPKRGPGGGPVNWLRHAVANRASVELADDFQHGMKSWSADGSLYPAGWQRQRDGYMQTGPLALFAPTRGFTDYKMEFFSQIESKSVGWVVRARDEKNYHAMKFTVLQAGLRPVIAVVHYNVVDGQPGRKTQTPLNIMVHNSRPIQVAVNVRGNHFITSIDGEEVDTFINDALPTGGVGFFSEAGERARLYWAKVTKNDDWLGHVCAFLSGDSQTTAELWPPAIPGGTPSPWAPAESDPPVLAAAWIGLPYLRRIHLQRNKPCHS
jgi:hypothetical protein